MIDYEKMPPSRQPAGSFAYVQQRPSACRGTADFGQGNQLRIYRGEKPCWMPVCLWTFSTAGPCLREHAPFEATAGWFGGVGLCSEVGGRHASRDSGYLRHLKVEER
jgi:hypothetical protein